jgi:FkbM family methyltransferase
MSVRSNFVMAIDIQLPSLMNWLRFHRHVTLNRDIVYPSLTGKMFQIMQSRNLAAIDVGANTGIFTRYLRKHFAHTVAVEPIEALAKALRILESDKVSIHCCALGEHDGKLTIRTPVDAQGTPMLALSTASAGNSLNLFAKSAVIETEVAQRRLSDLPADKRRVGFVKIDVEGFEEQVLLGAEAILTRDRPILMIEIARIHNPQYRRVLDLMHRLDYQAFSISKSELRNDASQCIERQQIIKGATHHSQLSDQFDFMFIHRDQLAIFNELINSN